MSEMVRLGDVVNVSASNLHLPDEDIWLLNLDMVEQQTGNIIDYNYVSKEKLNGSIIQFDTENVLYSKLRPNLNKVVIPKMNGYATSEMLPLRPNMDFITKEYLCAYLRSDSFVTWAVSKTSGAKMPRLGTKELLSKTIPLPPLSEQRRIAAVLDKVSKLIALRKRQLDLLDEMVKARFVEMFGTINENPKHYPMAMLKDICHKITDGKHGGCEQESNSGYFYVGAREIFDNSIHYETAPQITYTDFAKDYKRCNIEVGDFVIVNTGATIGKSAIATSPLTERTLLQKSVALLKVNTEHILSEFLRYCYIVNPSMYMVESASAQPNLLLSKIKTTVVYTPPIKLQNQFADFVQQVDKSKAAVQQGLDRLILLKSALMQEYFG